MDLCLVKSVTEEFFGDFQRSEVKCGAQFLLQLVGLTWCWCNFEYILQDLDLLRFPSWAMHWTAQRRPLIPAFSLPCLWKSYCFELQLELIKSYWRLPDLLVLEALLKPRQSYTLFSLKGIFALTFLEKIPKPCHNMKFYTSKLLFWVHIFGNPVWS